MSVPWIIIACLAILGAVLVAFLAYQLWSTRKDNLERFRANQHFREVIGSLVGWGADDRLLEDWADQLREGWQRTVVEAPTIQPAPSEFHPALQAISRLVDKSQSSGFRIDHNLQRLHQTLTNLNSGSEDNVDGESDPAILLMQGEFDFLFRHWRRLEAFRPEDGDFTAFAVAVAFLCDKLSEQGVQVHIPAPLTIAQRQDVTILNGMPDALRDDIQIQTRVDWFATRLNRLPQAEGLIVECASPGWSGTRGAERPKVHIWDASWHAIGE